MKISQRLFLALSVLVSVFTVSARPEPAPSALFAPVISISTAGSQVTVTWPMPNYSLESAYEVFGPWFPVPGAASGYTLTPDQAQQYFRLSSQTVNPTLLPSAANYSFSVLHDQTLGISPPGVLQFDSDPSSLLVTPLMASAPAHGNAYLAPDGSAVYTPAAHFVGTDSFYYVVTDGVNVSTPGQITITVTNTPPVAVADQYGVAENSYISVSAPGVLYNDYDPDGDSISVVTPQVSGPANGTLSLYPDGTFTYIPNANFTGVDSFAYVISDGINTSAPATVTLNVHGDSGQSPPVAGTNLFSTAHDQVLYVAAPGLLAQCSDPNSDPLSATLVTPTVNGTISLYGDGSLTYEPNPGFVGQDSFTYQVSDSTTNSSTATVTIEVTNSIPVAMDDSYTTPPGQPLIVSDSGVLANDTDADGDALTAQLASAPANGTVTMDAGGGFTYTPNSGFVGTDTFTYTASDGFTNSAPATVSIDVTNQIPVGVADVYGTPENLTMTVPAPGVLRNDYISNNDTLGAQLLTAPSDGMLTFETNGSLVYVPNAGFTGTDSFTYEATDGTVSSAPVTVTLEVNATNTPPVAEPDSYTVLAGDVLTVDSYDGVLANDEDAEDNVLTAVLVTGPSNAFDFALNSDGTFTYVPNVGFTGMDSFTYEAFDGLAYSAVTVATISVTNGGPAPANLSYATHFNTPMVVPQPGILGAVEDQDDNPLTAVQGKSPSHGTLSLMPDGSLSYAPNANYVGQDYFNFQVFDGAVTSAVMTVSISVTNTPPMASPDLFYTRENEAIVETNGVLANDIDPDGDALSAVLVNGPTNAASFNFNSDGTFAYTPQNGFVGSDTFTYQASDGVSLSAVTLVTITVANTPVAVPDYYVYTPGLPLVVPAANGVLVNDFDFTDPTLTAQLVGNPPGVALNPDGSFTFLPPPSYSSMPVTFQYVAVLNGLTSAPATVTLVSSLLAAPVPAVPPLPPPPPPIIIKQLVFTGGTALIADDAGAAGSPFKPPQWLDLNGDGVIDTLAGDRMLPYSYAAGQTLAVTPEFTVNDVNLMLAQNLNIQGVLYDKNKALGITIQCKLLRAHWLNLFIGVAPSTASVAFGRAAAFYDPLTIKWQYSTDGLAVNSAKKVWQPCGTTKNTMYVTLAPPATSLTYQTAVEIGCREGAGLSDSSKMFTNIWKYFSKIKVSRVLDGRPLTYYKDWSVGNTTVGALLKERDGQCGSWCDIFKATLENQGIAGASIIDVESVKSGENFLVKNWTFGAIMAANPLNGQRTAKYRYINIPRNDPPASADMIPATGQNYNWWSSVVRSKGKPDVTFAPEVNDAVDGVPGENNARPAKYFMRHFVININGQYYDPSYGLTYANSQDLYTKAIAGFAIGQNAPYDGFINDGSAVVTYNNALAILLIRKAMAGGPDQLKTEEIDQKLVFVQQPGNTKQMTPITPAVQVQVRDWNNNPIKVAATTVTISLYNVGAATPTAVAGATAMTDANGIATFPTLQVNMAIPSCKLLAQSTAAVGAISVAFKITK